MAARSAIPVGRFTRPPPGHAPINPTHDELSPAAKVEEDRKLAIKKSAEMEAEAGKKVATSIFASIAAAKAKNRAESEAEAEAKLTATKAAGSAAMPPENESARDASAADGKAAMTTTRSFRGPSGEGGGGSGGWIHSKRKAIERQTQSPTGSPAGSGAGLKLPGALSGRVARLPRSTTHAVDRPVSDFLADLGIGWVRSSATSLLSK